MTGGFARAQRLWEIGEQIAASIRTPGFRGCAFLNAAAEYPDAGHPVHEAVLAHRAWFLKAVTDLIAQTHETAPEGAGRHFVMLRDGVMAAGCLGDPIEAGETFLRGINGLLRVHAIKEGVRPGAG
ncbi:hypothetical protein GCM10010435_25650 [Winogradskya consettensis]|uniref:Tetracyclin repressor-like C-terminal domain-containing protein n=1 Tax=Winogradskya consettensis TaxID=113560 RepID=A0A919VSK9_9ACTN|nr:hypothetical protein [Actinoplanes consettensis]GIM67931.1 hypothetical protein Aco04nite_08440 [Actinoplanes consettensis]